MKLLNYKAGDTVRFGIKVDNGIIDVEKAAKAFSIDAPTTMEKAFAAGEKGLAQLAELAKKNPEIISEDNLVYAPCVTNPDKILCVGLNYLAHAAEAGAKVLGSPCMFSKFTSALAAHNEVIKFPKAAENIDYEAELVIIMGKQAVDVSKEDALSYVFGYTTGNDLTSRVLQRATSQWLLGKSLAQSGPMGPYVLTADCANPNELDIKCEVNGTTCQSSNTRLMIYDCATIISYVSKYLILEPGDVIFTGTPNGVITGLPKDQQVWLKPGDTIKVTIEKIGTLSNVLA